MTLLELCDLVESREHHWAGDLQQQLAEQAGAAPRLARACRMLATAIDKQSCKIETGADHNHCWRCLALAEADRIAGETK